MKIGTVIHGADAIDSGFAIKTIEALEELGKVTARLGGTTGRTAIIDHKLENRIDITQRERPTQALQRMFNEDHDIVCLVNQGKTLESGLRFAELILNKIKPPTKPLLLIEGMGAIGCHGNCRKTENELIEKLSKKLNLPQHSFNPKNTITKKETRITRQIGGIHPGELIHINGTIIGKATSSQITITTENNTITAIKGCKIKPHGLEKLQQVDLTTAVIRGGTPRQRPTTTPRQIHQQKKNIAVLIDHDAESTLEKAKHANIVITIGDDTTTIAADILYRLNTPIIGITDGDKDGLLTQTQITKNSLIIQVAPGLDDVMGKQIKHTIFKDAEQIPCPNPEQLKKQITKLLQHKTVKTHTY
jgi:hypothetical protein